MTHWDDLPAYTVRDVTGSKYNIDVQLGLGPETDTILTIRNKKGEVIGNVTIPRWAIKKMVLSIIRELG